MAIEALEGVTDEQLFNEANADEAPADEAVVSPLKPAEQVEQPRDEAGRFAASRRTSLSPRNRSTGTARRLTTTQQWFRRGVCGRSTRKSGRRLPSWRPCEAERASMAAAQQQPQPQPVPAGEG
jgi:hypothetical protein